MVSRTLKWVAGGLEALLAIPVLGGTIVIGFLYIPLFIMLALHIVGLIFAIRENKLRTGHILGIVTSCVAWIPFVGWVMHVLSAVFLMVEAGKDK